MKRTWVLTLIAGLGACSGEVGQGLGRAPPDGSGSSLTPVVAVDSGTNTGLNQPVAGADTVGGAVAGEGGNPALVYTPAAPAPPALPVRVWRLSHSEYTAAIVDLLGVQVDTSDFITEIVSADFANYAELGLIRINELNDYRRAADTLVDALSEQQLASLGGCQTLAADCADGFITQVGTRAFRRPLTTAELARHRRVFDAAAGATDAALPFRVSLKSLLTSPNFLYRTEYGPAEAQALTETAMTPYEVASFLSFGLLGMPPDAALLDAAARGELLDPVSLRTNISQLLLRREAADRLSRFFQEWIEVDDFDEVDKFETDFPGFETSRSAIVGETDSYFRANAGMSGTLTSLLTGPVPAADSTLSSFYNAVAPGPVRSSLFMLGSFLSEHAKPNLTSPTQRGLLVRERMFCQQVSLPPNLVPDLAETQQTLLPGTTRELYELHQKDASCAGCHRLVDNIGFTMENFDGAGRYRVTENGNMINTTSELINSDVNRTLSSPIELAAALSESQLVRECLATQMFRFYFGQDEGSRGLPPITVGYEALQQGQTFSEMLISMLSTESTYLRTRN